jgi:large subunit ribosomal protein L13
LKGPRYHRGADRIVRRTIRGMIPYKTAKGKEAFQRVMTYIGVPPEFASTKMETYDDININNTDNIQFVTIKEISTHLGAK